MTLRDAVESFALEKVMPAVATPRIARDAPIAGEAGLFCTRGLAAKTCGEIKSPDRKSVV